MHWLRGLDPRLPRDVQLLQLGGLANAFGNGVVLPFMLIYLHNVQGISLGVAGLILATNGFVSIAAGQRPSASSRSASPATSSSTARGRDSSSRP
jgi:hypothetical protein